MKLKDVEKQIGEIDIETLARVAHQEGVEIVLTIEPGNVEVRIEPWKPIAYNCPFNTLMMGSKTTGKGDRIDKSKTGNNKNDREDGRRC